MTVSEADIWIVAAITAPPRTTEGARAAPQRYWLRRRSNAPSRDQCVACIQYLISSSGPDACLRCRGPSNARRRCRSLCGMSHLSNVWFKVTDLQVSHGTGCRVTTVGGEEYL